MRQGFYEGVWRVKCNFSHPPPWLPVMQSGTPNGETHKFRKLFISIQARKSIALLEPQIYSVSTWINTWNQQCLIKMRGRGRIITWSKVEFITNTETVHRNLAKLIILLQVQHWKVIFALSSWFEVSSALNRLNNMLAVRCPKELSVCT